MNLRKKSKWFQRKSLIPCFYIIKAESCSIFQKYKRAVVPQDYKTPTSFCIYFLALYSGLWQSGKDSLSTDVTNYRNLHERCSDALVMSSKQVKSVITTPFF